MNVNDSVDHPIRLPIKGRLLNRIVTGIAGLQPLIAIYDSWLGSARDDRLPQGEQLLEHALSALNASLVWQGGTSLQQISGKGPVIVVANHPLGGLEGMLLTREMLKFRSDTKVLTNEMLLRIPEFADLFIGLDVLSGNASRRNASGIRAACRHLNEAGALLIFPAGLVARIRPRKFCIEDHEWNSLVGWLARRYRAACLPVHIDARNSLGFYLAGLIHRRLRTFLLPRELANKRDCVVRASAGELLTARDIDQLGDAENITRYLRLCTDLLAPTRSIANIPAPVRTVETIAADVEAKKLQQQLANLEPYRLVDDDVFSVYCAPYHALGCFMHQIAVDREKTFRMVDEGTGQELDSDNFDSYYWHLWAWNKKKQEIVGAYRVGKIDEIIDEHGMDCLYSRTVYKFDHAFISRLGSAIEVGRSFVTLPYQRHPKALDLLWRGIGAFMVRNPKYHTLFGGVSISQQYSTLARAFLADAMMTNFSVSQEWQQQVRPRAPLRVSGKLWTPDVLASLGNIAVINKLLGNLDHGKRIPILLRHYLALNGRFASFAVNTTFNHSLDGLVIVDLREAPMKYLIRYLGKEGSESFLQRWRQNVEAA